MAGRQRADAVVLSCCVQMPSLAAVQPVEDVVSILVLSAATASVHGLCEELGPQTRARSQAPAQRRRPGGVAAD